MNLYVTSESYYRIKNGFSNINAFAIIDVNLILDTLKLDMTKTYNVFLDFHGFGFLCLNLKPSFYNVEVECRGYKVF